MFEQLGQREPPTPHQRPEPRPAKKLQPLPCVIGPAPANPWGLTPVQCAVLNILTEGKTAKETAQVLGISNKTVETHSLRARQRMKARNTMHAVLMWDRHQRQ